MFPVSAIHAEPEDIRALPAGEAPGRRDLREGHVSGAQEERLVTVLSTAPFPFPASLTEYTCC